MLQPLNFIAAGRVIISGNIENIGHDFSNGSRLFGFGSFIDESAHFVHHDIEKFRGWSIIHSSGTIQYKDKKTKQPADPGLIISGGAGIIDICGKKRPEVGWSKIICGRVSEPVVACSG